MTEFVGREILIPIDIDRDSAIHEAGWRVVQEPVERTRQLLTAARCDTEDAWQDGNTARAIHRAHRVLKLEQHLARIEAEYPDLTAHGPRQHWADRLFGRRDYSDAWHSAMSAGFNKRMARANEELVQMFDSLPKSNEAAHGHD